MKQETIEYLRVECIDTKPQVRENADDASIHGLAVSLREIGLKQAVRVRREGERLIIVDGERRLRAARLLKWDRIPAIVEEQELNPAAVIQHQIIANVQRKNLSEIEVARAIEALIQAGWTAEQVGAKLGFSSTKVSRLRALLMLPPEIQEQVQKGMIAASTAYQIKVHGGEKQAELANDAAKGALKRDDVKPRARNKPKTASPKQRRPTFRMKVPAGDEGTLSLSGPKVPLKLFISSLEELLARAREAERQGTEFSAFAT